TATAAKGQHIIAGYPAEPAAEQLQYVLGERIARQRRRADLGRRRQARGMAVHGAHGTVELQQAVAAEHAFRTDMAELTMELLPERRLAQVAHWQVDMAALPRQRLPASFSLGQQRADAEAGARPDHHRRAV